MLLYIKPLQYRLCLLTSAKDFRCYFGLFTYFKDFLIYNCISFRAINISGHFLSRQTYLFKVTYMHAIY